MEAETKVNNADIIDAYDKWQHGVISKQEYGMIIIEKLHYYIVNLINKRNRASDARGQRKQDEEDCISAGYVAILSNLDKYDPRKSMPTSFFGYFIEQEQREAIKRESPSRHYVEALKKIEASLRRNNLSMSDPIPPEKISIISGLPLKTVIEAMNSRTYVIGGQEEIEKNAQSSVYYDPQLLVVEREKSQYIRDAISGLSHEEKLVLYFLGNQKNSCKSIKQIVRYMNRPEIQKEIGISEKVDEKYVYSRVMSVKRKVLHYPYFHKYLSVTEGV